MDRFSLEIGENEAERLIAANISEAWAGGAKFSSNVAAALERRASVVDVERAGTGRWGFRFEGEIGEAGWAVTLWVD